MGSLHPDFEPDRLVQGWSSTIIVVLFFGGVQMLTIGILGEYLSSIFNEIKGRPEYIVETALNFERGAVTTHLAHEPLPGYLSVVL